MGSNGPAPTAYNIESIFTPKISRQRGKSFGLSRELANAPCYNFLGDQREKSSKPGPGWYEQKSTKSTLQFSMGQKTGSAFMVQNKTPGPGSYNPPALSPDGKYAISTFKSYGTCLFNPKNSSRWAKESKEKVPPPHYKIVDSISKNGRYITSKYRSQRVSSFGYGDRTTFGKSKADLPGPGSYKVHSDFGYQQ
ncbi:hypothetical protein PPERSA_02648 [Pseudocohnilembus persalinus]|uniref:Sperm-tail PG-rich repeat n=1 Tax=Pseudocohnilembus persalinus TaxID=266149 RepID=A0A0V0R5Y9_PSEPJ|nr:hypothetical protein PPERSA_02648 [Pseudocohnilembus persalinus]|eukprot:KRX09776.1 hypothetical protein PPERSA_02648 [Pseudocohnilembus persalinus]